MQGEYPFCKDQGADVHFNLTNEKEFVIPYARLQPCRLEDEDQTLYGLQNNGTRWEDFTVELIKEEATDKNEPFVGYKHIGASKRLGSPYCLGSIAFGSAQIKNDAHIYNVLEGDLGEGDAKLLQEGRLFKNGKNLTESIDGDFVFLFPCTETDELKEYKKELDQRVGEANRDGKTENGVLNYMEYLGTAANFVSDEKWKYPHYCGLSEEPTESGGCKEENGMLTL